MSLNSDSRRPRTSLGIALEGAGIAKKSFGQCLADEMKRVNFSPRKVEEQSHLSMRTIKEFVRDSRLPSQGEAKKLYMALPGLRKMHFDFPEEAPKRAHPQAVPAPVVAKIATKEEEKTVVLTPKTPKPVTKTVGIDEVRISPLVVTTKTEGQFTAIEEIGPEAAGRLLLGNVRNRSLSIATVEAYARDMAEGNWKLSHQGIAVDRDCRVIDGQHRLHAIIKSGSTIRTSVTYNADPESFKVVDQLRPRTIADVVGLTHGTTSNTLLVATLRVMDQLVGNRAIRADKYTQAEVEEIYAKFGEDVKWAIAHCKSRRLRLAGCLAGIAYAYPADPAGVESFCDIIVSREGMTSPMVSLERAAERMVPCKGATERVELSLITLRSLWAAMKGETLHRTYMRAEASAETSPAFRHWRSLRLKKGLPVN